MRYTLNIHKICNNCNKHINCTDIDMLLSESKHGNKCKFVDKIINNKWWKFWIRETYNYIK